MTMKSTKIKIDIHKTLIEITLKNTQTGRVRMTIIVVEFFLYNFTSCTAVSRDYKYIFIYIYSNRILIIYEK